jgi:nucleoside-diphosphate-sugar epimerase
MNRELHVVLGSGPAGLAVAEQLLTHGKAVRVVNRSSRPPLPAGAEHAIADATDADQMRQVCAGAAAVYNCTHAPYHQWDDLLPRLQDAVMAGAAAAGATLVVIDTLYPYGPTAGVPMTEQSPNAATSRKGRLRARLTAKYLAACQAGRLRVAIGRSGDFYGPRVLNSALGGTVFLPALLGGPVLAMGDLDLPHSYTYLPDAARGLVALGTREEALGRVWHLPTAAARSTREIHTLIAAELGHPLTADVLTEPRPWGPLDEAFMREYDELFYQYNEPHIVDSTALEHTFGLQPTALDEGMRTTLRWYRAHLAELTS